ncbi:hypothetical protein D9M68_541790 [compost metagenome]
MANEELEANCLQVLVGLPHVVLDEVLAHVEWKARKVLKHADHTRRMLGRRPRQLARRRLVEPAQQFEQGRLTGTVLAYDRNDLSIANLQVDLLKRRALGIAVPQTHVAQRHARCGHRRFAHWRRRASRGGGRLLLRSVKGDQLAEWANGIGNA